ncbi:hypothetical protein [Pontibacter roseus]|uniref:hypothetical protein n=1 Tax=Pontibacter roseus TaxID=336989 RepID=UPI0003760793|nr:hypothetical protein [Pontibacter roseus]
MDKEQVLFRERQRFTQFWLWALLLGLAAIMLAGFVYQVLLGGTFGSRPVSDVPLSIMAALIGFGLPFFFYWMSLTTEVRAGVLSVRFAPFHLKPVRFPLHLVRNYEKTTYNPIRDYGGWGIRWGDKGKAYSTSGSEGILLHFYNQKPLLIGSHRPHELLEAIERAKELGKGIEV